MCVLARDKPPTVERNWVDIEDEVSQLSEALKVMIELNLARY